MKYKVKDAIDPIIEKHESTATVNTKVCGYDDNIIDSYQSEVGRLRKEIEDIQDANLRTKRELDQDEYEIKMLVLVMLVIIGTMFMFVLFPKLTVIVAAILLCLGLATLMFYVLKNERR